MRLEKQAMVAAMVVNLASFTVDAAPNPAAAYAWLLGHEYRVVEETDGARGVVSPAPGIEYDAWDFFRGKVGNEHQYGALFGFRTECVRERRGDYVIEYAVCVATGGLARAGERLPLADLMTRHGQTLTDRQRRRSPRGSSGGPDVRFEDFGLRRESLPPSFDWRNVGGRSYIGPIRDQGACGSCYAFGANAAAEGAYNKVMNLTDGAWADFSESFIIWTLARQPAYRGHFYGCNGSDYDYAELQALVDMGVCRETDYPYQENDPGWALHLDKPRVRFDSWSRIACNDVEAIKAALMIHGVIDAAVDASSFDGYVSGIYSDNKTSCFARPCYNTPTDHIIALVGWDDNPPEGGGGCWILRNSWGRGWGENGYMRIRYNAARVACEACYLVYAANEQASLTVTSAYGSPDPSVGTHVYPTGTVVVCRLGGSPDTYGATQYVCMGWTGMGDVPAVGSATNTGAFTLTQNSSIAWAWQTRVLLQADVSGSGMLSFTGGWQVLNATIAITAAPTVAGVNFVRWVGDTNDCAITGSVVVAPMICSRRLTAVFSDGAYLDPPVNLIVSRGTQHGRVALSWNPVVGASHYRVWRGISPSSGTAQLIGQSTTATFLDTTVSRGRRYTYWVQSASSRTTSVFSASASGWSRPVVNDYDGAGGSDPAVFNALNGVWYVCTLVGASVVWDQPWGWPGAVPVPGDYDADGKADFAVFDVVSGVWYILGGDGVILAWAEAWGWPGALPVPGDYDGDGASDLAVFDSYNGHWYARGLDGTIPVWAEAWGWSGAVPVPGDYDADGISDFAVFDSYSGTWYVRSMAGPVLAWAQAWGWPGALPVPGDYDGDGASDLAVFDSTKGSWYILGLHGSLWVWAEAWGWPGAVPVPGDYNDDGISDFAVFDSNSGAWFILSPDRTLLAWNLPWGWPGAHAVGGRY